MQLSKPLLSIARHNPRRENLVRGLPNEWHCGAGPPRYICEDVLVHYCVAQRGHPATYNGAATTLRSAEDTDRTPPEE